MLFHVSNELSCRSQAFGGNLFRNPLTSVGSPIPVIDHVMVATPEPRLPYGIIRKTLILLAVFFATQ